MSTTRNYLLHLLALLLIGTPSLVAQVSGISYTLSPSANYTFWDQQAGLGDGILAGGHLGIGFGENVELRGMYLFDVGLQRDFSDVLGQELAGLGDLAERDINLSRYGGEVRLNIGRSRLLPFLTLGAGIQSIEMDGGLRNEHVFASGGLGITLKVADRFTFKLEGKNTAYNFNPVRNLLTAEERTGLSLGEADFFNERLSNWSIGTGLTVYLGGRRPGTLTELDRAYAEAFTGGFSNISLLVEPTLSRINFDNALPYRDLYLGGAGIGLDFGPLVGFRAFYLQGMEDDRIGLDFDDIAVYGADFRFRFSSSTTGLSPFVSLGGGYIDTQEGYLGNNNTTEAVSQAFASGGLGASLNLSRSFSLTGNYKVLLTTSEDVENVESTDQIATSNQWSVGINLAFGKKAKRPDAMFTSVAQQDLERQQVMATLKQQSALADQARRNAEATKQLRNDYEGKIYQLKEALGQATAQRDTVAIDSLQSVISETEAVVTELQSREADLQTTIAQVSQDSMATQARIAASPNTASSPITAPAAAPQNAALFQGRNADGSPAPPVSRLTFTPAEFEGLIEEIFEGLNYGMPAMPMEMMPASGYEVPFGNRQNTQDTARINALERQLDQLRSTVEKLSEKQTAAEKARAADKEILRQEMKEGTQSILDEIRAMRTEIGNKSNMTDKEREQLRKEAEKAAKAAADADEKARKEAQKAADKKAKAGKNN